MEGDELLTIEQAAELLDVSPMTVYRRIKQNRLPAVKLHPAKDRPLAVRREDVERLKRGE